MAVFTFSLAGLRSSGRQAKEVETAVATIGDEIQFVKIRDGDKLVVESTLPHGELFERVNIELGHLRLIATRL